MKAIQSELTMELVWGVDFARLGDDIVLSTYVIYDGTNKLTQTKSIPVEEFKNWLEEQVGVL